MPQQLSPQRGDDPVGGTQRGNIGGTVQRGANENGHAEHDDGGQHRTERCMVQEGALDHRGQGHGLHDDGHRADGGERHRRDADPPESGDPGGEIRVDQPGPGPRGLCAQSLNVVSFTETARPMRPSVTARQAVSESSQVAAVRTPSGRSATMTVRTGSNPSSPP